MPIADPRAAAAILREARLVMAGPMHAAVPMAADDVFRAEFDRLGPVTVRVTEG